MTGINQRISISDGSLIFIELLGAVNWFPTHEGNSGWWRRGIERTNISGPWSLIPGARSLVGDVPSMRLRTHDLVWCRASCPLESGYCRDIRGCGLQLVFWSAIRASWTDLGPSGINGLSWTQWALRSQEGRYFPQQTIRKSHPCPQLLASNIINTHSQGWRSCTPTCQQFLAFPNE